MQLSKNLVKLGIVRSRLEQGKHQFYRNRFHRFSFKWLKNVAQISDYHPIEAKRSFCLIHVGCQFPINFADGIERH